MKTDSTLVQIALRSLVATSLLFGGKLFSQRSDNRTVTPRVLVNFKGKERDGKIELQWQLDRNNAITKIVVECADESLDFWPTYEISVASGRAASPGVYHYSDYRGDGIRYYRLKLISTNGNIQYSNILVFRSVEDTAASVGICPSSFNPDATARLIIDGSLTRIKTKSLRKNS